MILIKKKSKWTNDQCVVVQIYTRADESAHECKQALAQQALSHAKGHYLAAVSSNRNIAGWETDPGSVPSLQRRTIWQQRHVCVSAVRVYICCAPVYVHASVAVYVSKVLGYQTPL